LAHTFFVADSRKPLTEAELEEILNDSDFYLSDDKEVVTNEVDDADLADVEDPEPDQLEDTVETILNVRTLMEKNAPHLMKKQKTLHDIWK
jgi:hypothetical protein